MARKPKVRSITVIGREWFAREPGLTYFTAVILVNGVQVGVLRHDTGHGDRYIHTAHEWLAENGYLPKMDRMTPPLSLLCRDQIKCALYCVRIPVLRELDL